MDSIKAKKETHGNLTCHMSHAACIIIAKGFVKSVLG